MSAEWQSPAFRQCVVSKVNEAIASASLISTRNGAEMENYVFSQAETKEEYLGSVAKLLIHVRDTKNRNAQQQQQNSNMMAVAEWQTPAYRESVIRKINEAIASAGLASSRNGAEMEDLAFSKATTREEYLRYIDRLIINVRCMQDPINALESLASQGTQQQIQPQMMMGGEQMNINAFMSPVQQGTQSNVLQSPIHQGPGQQHMPNMQNICHTMHQMPVNMQQGNISPSAAMVCRIMNMSIEYVMAEEWQSLSFRLSVATKINEAIAWAGLMSSKNGAEMEKHLYGKARTKVEYLASIAKLIIHVKDTKGKNAQRQQEQQQQNPGFGG